MLSKTNKYKDFIKICADPNSGNKIPKIIKQVPTIIVPEQSNPLVGEQVFLWIRPFINNKEDDKKDTSGPSPYVPLEMSGSSDRFSFLETTKKFGIPLKHNYAYIKKNGEKEEKKNNTSNKTNNNRLNKLSELRDNDPFVLKSVQRF